MFKTYSSSSSLVITSRWFATSRLAVPASVKVVYCWLTTKKTSKSHIIDPVHGNITGGLALVPIMACRLFSAKPLPEPMLAYCQLDSWEHISVKYELKFHHFHSRKCNWKYHLPKWRPFCPGGDELTWWLVWHVPLFVVIWSLTTTGHSNQHCLPNSNLQKSILFPT